MSYVLNNNKDNHNHSVSTNYMAFFLMTVITLRLTALALYRKPSTNVNAPPPIT